MQIEYEATFVNVNKDETRQKLKTVGAKLIKPEFLQRRVVFNLPKGHEIEGGWLRVRDEGDKITMSLKIIDGSKIENQREIYLEVNSFEEAEKFLVSLGCHKKAYQENKRELWKLDNMEITIDEWPFLEPFIEIEGKYESEVKGVTEKIGFNYKKALFCAVGTLYESKYGLSEEIINNNISRITFDIENPFLKKD